MRPARIQPGSAMVGEGWPERRSLDDVAAPPTTGQTSPDRVHLGGPAAMSRVRPEARRPTNVTRYQTGGRMKVNVFALPAPYDGAGAPARAWRISTDEGAFWLLQAGMTGRLLTLPLPA